MTLLVPLIFTLFRIFQVNRMCIYLQVKDSLRALVRLVFFNRTVCIVIGLLVSRLTHLTLFSIMVNFIGGGDLGNAI